MEFYFFKKLGKYILFIILPLRLKSYFDLNSPPKNPPKIQKSLEVRERAEGNEQHTFACTGLPYDACACHSVCATFSVSSSYEFLTSFAPYCAGSPSV